MPGRNSRYREMSEKVELLPKNLDLKWTCGLVCKVSNIIYNKKLKK